MELIANSVCAPFSLSLSRLGVHSKQQHIHTHRQNESRLFISTKNYMVVSTREISNFAINFLHQFPNSYSHQI